MYELKDDLITVEFGIKRHISTFTDKELEGMCIEIKQDLDYLKHADAIIEMQTREEFGDA